MLHDDGDHVLWTSLRTANSTMMGPGGANCLRIHSRTCGSCVGKCTSSLVRTGCHP